MKPSEVVSAVGSEQSILNFIQDKPDEVFVQSQVPGCKGTMFRQFCRTHPKLAVKYRMSTGSGCWYVGTEKAIRELRKAASGKLQELP